MRNAKLVDPKRAGYILLSVAVAFTPLISSSIARAETLLHSFGPPPDGTGPSSGVIRGPDGTLYGTTQGGGRNNCFDGGCVGTVYKITPQKKEVLLHVFDPNSGGYYPWFEPALDANGNLYGTASSGEGANYYGLVFKLAPDGTYTTLYTFSGGADGGSPNGVTLDAEGNVYGVTYSGGMNDQGVLYEITSQGQFQVLHAFSGGDDGATPFGTPVLDEKGNVFGTTESAGAYGYGTVYEVTSKGKKKVLYSFGATSGYTDGCSPTAGVVRDDDGNLYGTTQGCGANAYGTLYKLSPSGRFTVLHAFGGTDDGRRPQDAPTLVKNDAGKIELYGTTPSGGTSNRGVAYKCSGKGRYKVIYNFTGGASDAYSPVGLLATDGNGKFYGASNSGGTNDEGTVFQFSSR